MDLEMVSTSPQAQPVKKFKVKLKIVGDGLNDLENHQDPVVLKLNCNSPNKRCQADFYDGKHTHTHVRYVRGEGGVCSLLLKC